MSETEFVQKLEEARARTTTIQVFGRDWKVTPFHCVVGPVIPISPTQPYPNSDEIDEMYKTIWAIRGAWRDSATARRKQSWAGTLEPVGNGHCVYPTEWQAWVNEWRKPTQHRPEGCWTLNYTGNPLIVNEMQLGEVSLAVVENGEIVLTNFIDLHDPISRIKVYQLGEWWLSYATGGEERLLRFGGSRA